MLASWFRSGTLTPPKGNEGITGRRQMSCLFSCRQELGCIRKDHLSGMGVIWGGLISV